MFWGTSTPFGWYSLYTITLYELLCLGIWQPYCMLPYKPHAFFCSSCHIIPFIPLWGSLLLACLGLLVSFISRDKLPPRICKCLSLQFCLANRALVLLLWVGMGLYFCLCDVLQVYSRFLYHNIYSQVGCQGLLAPILPICILLCSYSTMLSYRGNNTRVEATKDLLLKVKSSTHGDCLEPHCFSNTICFFLSFSSLFILIALRKGTHRCNTPHPLCWCISYASLSLQFFFFTFDSIKHF